MVDGECPHWVAGYCRQFSLATSESVCARCQADGEFRMELSARAAMRRMRRRDTPRTIVCARYGIEVNEEFCEECQRNGYLRQLLFVEAPLGMGGRICRHRGERREDVARECCGGRTKMFPSYQCRLLGTVIVPQLSCSVCSSFAQQTEQTVPNSCGWHPSLGEGKGVRESSRGVPS